MMEFGILMIVFGFFIALAGLYLVKKSKSDFTNVLLWKSNVKKMTVKEIKYAGKVTMFVALAPVITGIVALFMQEDSIIPIIVLVVMMVLFLIIAIKIFK